MLSKEDILNADDGKIEKINVPEWGGFVFVKTLTGKNRDQIEFILSKSDVKSFENIRGKIASWTICDEKGNTIFNDSDVEALGNKSGAALSRIFNRVMEINRITEEDIEELQKN